jgi:uncharacterized membrane protein YtjA (UPF0391 family)
MKNYTSQFLIITVITLLLGYTGLDFPGDTAIRFICLVSGIALLLSCLDAVLVSKQMKKIRIKESRKDIRE